MKLDEGFQIWQCGVQVSVLVVCGEGACKKVVTVVTISSSSIAGEPQHGVRAGIRSTVEISASGHSTYDIGLTRYRIFLTTYNPRLIYLLVRLFI